MPDLRVQDLAFTVNSSNHEQQPLSPDTATERQTNGSDAYLKKPSQKHTPRLSPPTTLDQAARDPRDEAPLSKSLSTSRRTGTHTSKSPIDFDGLSWPSV